MGLIIPVVALVLLALPAFAAEKRITLYLDGAKVETVVQAAKGRAEVVLPASALPESLRIKPAADDAIDHVEIIPVRSDPKLAQQLERLAERREQLEDRLKALAAREQIFTAAAKSQSGKAPRKTKTNPEPLAAIRQGTDFAIAQLEGVYQAKRKAEKELKQIEVRHEAARKAGNIGGNLVRAYLKGKAGKITVSYLAKDLRWTPQYDFRASSQGTLVMSQRAVLPVVNKGTSVTLVPGFMGDSAKAQPVAVGGTLPEISRLSFPVNNLVIKNSPTHAATYTFTNDTGRQFPPGDAFCYVDGEYLGRFSFAGMTLNETLQTSCGN